jgi:hypothetical protein
VEERQLPDVVASTPTSSLSDKVFVEPRITQEEAFTRLSKTTKWQRELSIVKTELIHFPYYLFKISTTAKDAKKEFYLSSDGVQGEVAFIDMKNLSFAEKSDIPRFSFSIDVQTAKKKTMGEYQVTLSRLRTQPPEITNITESKIYYPFWIGYHKRQESYDFKAIDAVSGTAIGVKMRRAFLKAFPQRESTK